MSYHFIRKRRSTTTATAAGFRLVVPPTVFHSRLFLTSEFFAKFIDQLDLSGQRVADVGTGSGMLALSAARRGAAMVVAIDINPNAARAAHLNAPNNGLSATVTALCSNLLSAVAPGPQFDVILSSPPSFSGEPRWLADRAWHSGPANRDIADLFDRLRPGGRMFVLLSSNSDIDYIGALMGRANFRINRVAERSIFVESFVQPAPASCATTQASRRSPRSDLPDLPRRLGRARQTGCQSTCNPTASKRGTTAEVRAIKFQKKSSKPSVSK